MGGRGRQACLRNGFKGRSAGGWDREIRPAGRLEKPLRRVEVPVPQTDTGGRDEYSQALG
jgi:hypothetical protein